MSRVDDLVAVLPGLDLLAADVRRVGEVPEVVLDEPQHRVRDHVVEAVVGARGRTRPCRTSVVDPVELDLEAAPAVPRGSTATSSSVIAEAIQSASRCATSRSARSPGRRRRARTVARRPRRARTAPGPRLETRISGLVGHPASLPRPPAGSVLELGEDPQPVAQQARRQEVRRGRAPCRPARGACRARGRRGSRAQRSRGLLGRVDQVAGLAVLDLQRDAADVAGDRRPRPSRAPR